MAEIDVAFQFSKVSGRQQDVLTGIKFAREPRP